MPNIVLPDKISGVIKEVQKRPLIFFALLHAVLLLGIYSILDNSVGNCGVERSIAVNILDGQLPYSEASSEYPPLAILSFLLPALLCSAQPAYGFLFALEIYLINLAVIFIMAKLAARMKLGTWKVLGMYTLCLAAMGSIVTGRYDLLPAALVLAAIYAFVNGRNNMAWAALALGLTAKLYPAIIAPFFAIYLLRYRQYRKLAQGAAVFLAVVLVISLPLLIVDASGYWESISYHLDRGLHSESSYGSLLLVGKLMGLTDLTSGFSYGSWNLNSPLADNLAHAATYVTFGLLAFAYGMYARRLWQKPGDEFVEMRGGEMQSLLRYAALSVMIMLLASKLLSPQFLIWLCPLLPLVIVRWRYALPVLILIIGVITQYIYPYHYLEFEALVPHTIVLLAVRNFLLMVMAVVMLLPLRSQLASGEDLVAVDGGYR